MRRSLFVVRTMGFAFAFSTFFGRAHAQSSAAMPISVTIADRVASYTAGPLGANAPTANPQALSGFPAKQPLPGDGTGVNAPFGPDGGFFPLDVSNAGGGSTIGAAQHHPVYINQPPNHWGNPAALLTDLGQSDFIQIVDQYTGINGRNRYTLGAR